MAEGFGIDDIKLRTGISDTQLDRRLIDEDHLWKLAGLLGSYNHYVGTPGFGLNAADIADLKDIVQKEGHQFAMVEAFKKWFNVPRPGVGTYRSLIEILIKLDRVLLAEEVCRTGELLAKHNTCECDLFYLLYYNLYSDTDE